MASNTAIDYSQLSPFELKDQLIKLAKQNDKASTSAMLNAGRGNPNWIATTPREAFILLSQFALTEARKTWNEPNVGLAGMPHKEGCAKRFKEYILQNSDAPGAALLRDTFELATGKLKLDADGFVHELVDSIIGDNYPVPGRMLVNCEKIVHEFIVSEMCDGRPPKGKFDIFAVEGGTAAMCYVFNTLRTNKILNKGDTIALGVPIFTPYIEFAHLEEYSFKVVNIGQDDVAPDGRHIWQYTDKELEKLEDPKIKAFFLVNPANPPSYAIRQKSIDKIVEIVTKKRPDLIILTDDVYGTFVEGFQSLAAALPQNTILVYSYSKHFGCTGWRLGTVAIHQDNILDKKLAAMPPKERDAIDKRYASLTLAPREMKLIDRMVAESRSISLNHTAGLSLPQQVQMTLFSSFTLLDKNEAYTKRCRKICHDRMEKLYKGMGIPLVPDATRAAYYCELDLEVWAKNTLGPEFMEYVKTHRDPLDIVFALAGEFSTVLLNGSGFDGPPWSVRVSLANLDDDAYEQIGKNLLAICKRAEENWRNR